MYTVITGGFGHIGSWTARNIIEQGGKVLILDTRTTVPDCLVDSQENFIHLACDVTRFAELTAAFQQYRDSINGIIHTVGIMGEFVQANPHRNTEINVNGFLNVLEAARIFDIKKVAYTSTGAVYGAIKGIASETQHIPQPADLYSATKTSAEMISLQYGNTFDMDIRIARVYFIYGPGKLPSTFIKLYRNTFGVLEGLEGLQMERGFDQKLDFTNVQDAARGIYLLYSAEELQYRVYNIATGTASSVGEVAALAAEIASGNKPAEIGPGTLMPRCEALSIDLARAELGYEPQISLEEGLREYYGWIQSR
ncbi:MAG: NAD(P)-dependent oxidoreductase [Spirochaetia bacterium]|nr:NAD(P)-dependent oxidoreductase [Spirochaetia bacterium]